MEKAATKQPREKLWTTQFIFICIVATFARMCQQIQATTIPLYVKSLGYTSAEAGLMTTYYCIAALLLRPILGNMLDKGGRKLMLVIGTAVYGIAAVSLGWVSFLPLMYILRVIGGVGFSANSIAISTMSTDIIPTSRMTEGIGYFALTQTITTAIGPSIGLFLIEGWGYMASFWGVMAFSVTAIALSFLINYEKKRIKAVANAPEPESVTAEDTPEGKRKWYEKLVAKQAVAPALLILCSSLAVGSVTTFLPSYGISVGIESVGLFFTSYAIGMAISRTFVSKITTRFGGGPVLLVGIAVTAISYLCIIPCRSTVVLVIIGLFYGMGAGMTNVILNSAAIIATPKSRRGAANATFYLASDTGIGLGAFVWGTVADLFGMPSMYIGSALVVSLQFLLYFSILKKRMPKV